jgi:hypothetical protein
LTLKKLPRQENFALPEEFLGNERAKYRSVISNLLLGISLACQQISFFTASFCGLLE